MTSQINFTAVDTAYPIAGQDNNSQGFRDNFASIAAGLSVAKSEISALQSNAVLVANLTTNTAVLNNLQGSTISNALYTQFNGVVRNAGTVVGITDIDLHNGPLQIFTLSASTTLRFSNWPSAANVYAKIRVHIKNDGNGDRLPTLGTSNGGAIVYATGFPSLALVADGRQKVIEAWTYNSGATVFVRYLGEF